MVTEEIKEKYTSLPLKLSTKARWDKNFLQAKLDGKVQYQDDFIKILLDAFEEKYNSNGL